MSKLFALTIWQPWASLIMAGAKAFEFRGYAAPSCLTSQRIVIHAGARRMRLDEVEELLCELDRRNPPVDPAIARPLLETWLVELWKGMVANRHLPPHGYGLGTVFLGEPKRCTDLFPGDDDVDPAKWGWPLSSPKPFKEPIASRGQKGFWPWAPEPELFT